MSAPRLHRSRWLPIAVLAGLATVLCPGPARAGDGSSWRPVENPAAPGSGEPALVSGADGVVYLSWVESADEEQALRFATWDGSGWSNPRTVTRAKDGAANWATYPSLAALSDGTLFAQWAVHAGGNPYASHLRVAVSGDGGATWSPPTAPHRDSTETLHGFAGMAPVDGDRMGLVWLDGREMVGKQEGQPGADMTLRFTTVDRNGRPGEDTLLDSLVCDCCSTALAGTGDGSLLAVYRDRSPEEIRDISRMRLVDGNWSEPAAVHADGWKIPGCPVNGPAVASGPGGAAAAWFTGAGDAGRVWVAFSSDDGATFGEPIQVDDGHPLGRVGLVLTSGGEAVVSWMESAGDSAAIRVRRFTPRGPEADAGVSIPASGERTAGFPELVAIPDGVLVAWTEPGKPSRVRTAVVR